jgi:hypothetical protein
MTGTHFDAALPEIDGLSRRPDRELDIVLAVVDSRGNVIIERAIELVTDRSGIGHWGKGINASMLLANGI